jgi:membrane-bound ClpP family serine protease
MWLIAGVLLGLVVLASLIGFHVGPHAHAAAGILGAVAAIWLIAMAVDGFTAPILWALLSADVVVSAGIGTLAWKGLTTRGDYVADRRLVSPVGAEGVAVGDLGPEGIVRVNGENWSAVAVNGTVSAGSPVQVLRVAGVKLEVWGDEAAGFSPSGELDIALPEDDMGAPSGPSSSSESTSEGGQS